MYSKSRGIVIKEHDSGEKGKLLTILTEDRGLVYAKAAGGKNVKASYFRCVQLFTYSEFQFCTSASGYLTIVDAVFIRSYFDMSKSIEGFSLASYFTEICKPSIVGDTSDKDIVHLLVNAFQNIVKGALPLDHIKAVYEMRLASLIGYEPSLTECGFCGCTVPAAEKKIYFNFDEGSVCCDKCAIHNPLDTVELTRPVYLSILHSVTSDEKGLFAFKTDGETSKEFGKLCEKYILRRLEFSPKALPLYKSFCAQ